MMGGELRLKTRALCVVLSDRRESYSGKSFVVVENRFITWMHLLIVYMYL